MENKSHYSSKTIYILEDCPIQQKLITQALMQEYRVFCFSKLEELNQTLIHGNFPDIYLLDLHLPDGASLSFIRCLKSTENTTPIIIISAEENEVLRLECLKNGALDFLKKPISYEELRIKIQNHLKTENFQSDILSLKNIKINTNTNTVTNNITHEKIYLGYKEMALLAFLIKNKSRVYSRQRLSQILWNKEHITNKRFIDSMISKLRKKLKSFPLKIQSIYGSGYQVLSLDKNKEKEAA